jgi:phenylacetate-CoA ligase
MLVVRGVNLFPSQIEEILLRSQALTGHYQIEVRREGRLDKVAVRVEARPEIRDQDAMVAEAYTAAAHIKQTIGVSVNVTVEPNGAIARSAGKAQRVVDHRSRDR